MTHFILNHTLILSLETYSYIMVFGEIMNGQIISFDSISIYEALSLWIVLSQFHNFEHLMLSYYRFGPSSPFNLLLISFSFPPHFLLISSSSPPYFLLIFSSTPPPLLLISPLSPSPLFLILS